MSPKPRAFGLSLAALAISLITPFHALHAAEGLALATRPSYSGCEIQLLDDADKEPSKTSTASLYRYVAPTANSVKPAGQWNTIDIECAGPKIRITLNGKLIQDVDQTQVEEIKGKPLQGFVSLQNHGKLIEFRNLKLKKDKS